MQDKRYSNSAVDLCYMLVATPPGSPRKQLMDMSDKTLSDHMSSESL